MTLSLTRVSLAAASIAITTLAGADAEAFGCGGGGGGRSSGRLSIAYSRNVPHMASHAPRHNYQPTPTYQQPVYQQPVYQQPSYQQPVYQQPAVIQPRIVQQPALQQQVVPQPIAQQPAASPQAEVGSAGQSALNALSALDGGQSSASIPQFAPANEDRAPTLVGTWNATLPGENQVQLTLNADSSFRWTANSKGKVSTFEGRFTLTDGQLTLVRSGDQQQLAGAWAAEGTGFRFKLGNDSGLLFVRG